MSRESDPPTFESLGIPQRQAVTDTIFGKIRTYEDLEKWEVAFLVIAPLSMLCMLGFTIYNAATLTKDDFTFSIVLIISIVFCFFYVINGVLGERPNEISIFVIAGFIVLVYIILNYALPNNTGNGTPPSTLKLHETVKLVRLILICILGPVCIGFGIWAARQYFISRRLIFRTVGAEDRLQGACANRFFFVALLKFDFQLALSILVLVLQDGRNMQLQEKIILGVGVPMTLTWGILGYISMRYENRPLTFVFLSTSVLVPAYVIYRVVLTIKGFAKHDKADDSTILDIATLSFAVASILTRILLVITTVRVYRNYKIGLKEKMYPGDAAGIVNESDVAGKSPTYKTFSNINEE